MTITCMVRRVVYFLSGSSRSGEGYYWCSTENEHDVIGPFWSKQSALEWSRKQQQF